MNQSLKNVISFIKEALELKNKNIYTIKDYEIHHDYQHFFNQFKDLMDIPDYLSLNINSDSTFFKLKYIKEENKEEIPEVPEKLKKFIFLKDGNDIISLIDDLEKELNNEGLLNEYREYDKKIKEINRHNSLIDLYNSKYMELYNVYKRINDYEEKIEVIFGQKLMIWHDNSGNKIERYILEANLEIAIDPVNNIISLNINRDKFKGFVTDFLNLESYKIKDTNLLNEYVKQFNENTINEDFDLNEEVNKYINYASLENKIINREILDGEEIKTNTTYIFNNCGIIVRNKNEKLWIEDLTKIISMCSNTNFISPILNMFEVDFLQEDQVYNLLNDPTYQEEQEKEVLFPLPSNDEQYKIVDKVKSSNIVLVQGPPGTGKSHTIANLLSHYISEGKRVIVTSEKAKALEVLREKIPEKIRSLSLALLTSKGIDKDLEFSIETVLKHQEDAHELNNIKNEIENLNEKLKNNHLKKQTINRNIIDLMEKDTISHKEELNEVINFENTNDVTLMDLAIWLEKNKKYKLIPTNDIENYSYPNPREFFDKLDDIADDIKNNHYSISSIIPINEYLNNNDIELSIKENIGYKNYVIHSKELVNAIKQSNLNEEIVNQIKETIDKLSYLYQLFSKEWIETNVSYEPFINKTTKIKEVIEKNNKFIIETEEKLYDYSIKIDNYSNIELYTNIINKILELFNNNDKINMINKFKFNFELKKITGLLYNNEHITKDNLKKSDFINIANALRYYKLINNIKNDITNVLKIDLFKEYNIQENQFGKHQEKISKILSAIINFETYSNDIDNKFKQIINSNLFSISYKELSEEKINDIISDLNYYATEINNNSKSSKIINELREYYKNYNLQNLNRVLLSIETNQLEEFIKNKNLLQNEIKIVNQYNNLKKIYSHIVNDKIELINKYIYNFSFEEKQFFKENIEKVLKYHYVEKYYLLLENKENNLPELFAERERLIKEEKNIIEELVAKKGWYYQNLNMNYNISTSLNKWVNLKKKLGKGTGKNANLYLRQMREEMNTAKNAIPVWIMPIDKLIEQYPFTNEPPFDVLIMDESSQSSVFSISALTRAKKVIIVGDDKQISPTNAFTSIDGVNDIRAKYLKGNDWDLQLSRDTSIYDMIQTICGNKKITLTEHFRCLPEIIHFSNKEFYNMEINPLKVRSKENTIDKPIKTIYVPNATCKKIGSQVYNQDEIDRIIMLIGEISNDKQYDNKSIGIIALQNSNKYIQKLTELVMQKFGENFINERKIKIGTTYDFQGDERDVIILGMVVSSILENGDKYSFRALTTQEFNKSFNVAASRAKEQMVLVHSVKLEELSPNCNRYKLLNYCLNYDNEKEKEYEKLFESTFEKDIYNYLTSVGYNLVPQFKIGNYRLDFVLNNDNNQKIAIECDGDIYHGISELEHDLERQSVLERCGWKFVRIRASEFYYNKEKSTKNLIDRIKLYLNGQDKIIYNVINNDNIKNEKENIIKDNANINNDNNDLQKTLINNTSSEENRYTKDKEVFNEKKNDDSFILEPSQFKYMVLYCNGITRKEISNYYNVEYDTVKKSLQTIADRYKEYNIDNCIERFNKYFSNTKQYNNILNNYKIHNNKYIEKKPGEDEEKTNNNISKISNNYITNTINSAIVFNQKIEILYGEKNIKFILNPISSYESKNNYYLKAIDMDCEQIKLFKFEKINSIKISAK